MKALLFHKFKNICIKTILWTRNTNCFTIFVHRNFRRKSHSDCEYHIVPRPRKWGLIIFCYVTEWDAAPSDPNKFSNSSDNGSYDNNRSNWFINGSIKENYARRDGIKNRRNHIFYLSGSDQWLGITKGGFFILML